MTKLLALAVLLACTAQADKPTTPRATPVAPAPPAEVVRATILRHAESIEKRDLAALDALYAADPELLIIENAGADTGWKRYRDHHLAPELADAMDLRYRYANVRVDVEGSLAWATFTYELHLVIKDKPIDVAGRGTMVLRQQGGAWKIIHSHTSGKKK